jgi:hypothetical protein
MSASTTKSAIGFRVTATLRKAEALSFDYRASDLHEPTDTSVVSKICECVPEELQEAQTRETIVLENIALFHLLEKPVLSLR